MINLGVSTLEAFKLMCFQECMLMSALYSLFLITDKHSVMKFSDLQFTCFESADAKMTTLGPNHLGQSSSHLQTTGCCKHLRLRLV